MNASMSANDNSIMRTKNNKERDYPNEANKDNL